MSIADANPVRRDRPVHLVAHRAGNSPADVATIRPDADVVELDVHLFRRRLEVRHAKVLWPFARRWDRWELVPSSAPRPVLDDIIASADPDVHLWIDLKGFSRRLTPKVLAKLANRQRSTVSSRSWWILPTPAVSSNVQVVHSIGSRLQLRAFRWIAPVAAVAIDQRLVDTTTMAAIRHKTKAVFAWGVHDVERAIELIDVGADGLIVDGSEVVAEIQMHLANARSTSEANAETTRTIAR